MRIAVIADTHNQLPETLMQRLEKADVIWHLGDVCLPRIIEELETLRKPLLLVRGNNDFSMEWPAYLKEDVGGHRCLLIHIPPADQHLPQGYDAIFHGHTHVPRDEMVGGVRLLNPGCVGRPNKGAPRSFAWLSCPGGGAPLKWELELF